MGKVPPPVPGTRKRTKDPDDDSAPDAKRPKTSVSSLRKQQASHAEGFGKNAASKKKTRVIDDEKVWKKTFWGKNFRDVVSGPSGNYLSVHTIWKESVAKERLASQKQLDVKDKKRYWSYTTPVMRVVRAQVGGGQYLLGKQEIYEKQSNPLQLNYYITLALEDLEYGMEERLENEAWVVNWVSEANQFITQLRDVDKFFIRKLWEDPLALPEDKLDDEGNPADVNDEKGFTRFLNKIMRKNGGLKYDKETNKLMWTVKTSAYKKMSLSDWARALKLSQKQKTKYDQCGSEESKRDLLKLIAKRQAGSISTNFKAMTDDETRNKYCYSQGYVPVYVDVKEQVSPGKWETIPNCKQLQFSNSIIKRGYYVMVNFYGGPYVTGVATGTKYYFSDVYLVAQSKYVRDTAPPADIGMTSRFDPSLAGNDEEDADHHEHGADEDGDGQDQGADDGDENPYPPLQMSPQEEEEGEENSDEDVDADNAQDDGDESD